MKKYLYLLPVLAVSLFAFSSFYSAPISAAVDAVAGDACSSIGVSTVNAKATSILACLNDDKGKLVWKSMTDSGATASGTVGFFALVACPSGWTIANGSNGTVDMRGRFPRGLDAGAGLDPGRALGSLQADSMRNLTGTFYTGYGVWGSNPGTNDAAYASGFITAAKGTRRLKDARSGDTYYGRIYTMDASLQVPTAEEFRPYNTALLACQKN